MKKPFDFKSQSAGIIALFLILGAGIIYFLRDSISLFPSFIHAWTQSDRYALALGFLENGFDFFHPRTFNLATTEGITRVDFPIHEFIVALLMKVTGLHEPIIFRLYTLAYAITGLVFLYRLSQLFTNSNYKNLFVACFLFLCPVYLYYADGFLPSIPSLSNVFIGNFFYFKYKILFKPRDFSLAVFFLTLAALARLPFIIFLTAVVCQQSLTYFNSKKISKRELSLIAVALAFFIFYQCYNSWLGYKYGTQFLIQVLPASSLDQLKEWISDTWMHWRFEYFSAPQYFIIALLLLPVILNRIQKKIPEPGLSTLLLQAGISLTGSVIYFFLMIKQFPDHDYYFIDAFYPPLILLIIFLASLTFQNKILEGSMWIVILFFMYQSAGSAKDVMDTRYKKYEWDRVEITRENFTGTEKFLDSLGISKDAKVLVLDGYTTNTPLILMNRRGWTVNWTTEYRIREGLSQPFDIVAVQNQFLASDVVRNYPGIISQLRKFADNGRVSFYKKENNQQSRYQFFGIDSTTVLHALFPKDIAIGAETEYYDLFQHTATEFISGHPVKLLVSGKIQCGEGKPRLIASLNEGDNTRYYFLFDLDTYVQTDSWQPLLFQFVIPAGSHPKAMVKVYLWNNEKVPYAIRDMEVLVYR